MISILRTCRNAVRGGGPLSVRCIMAAACTTVAAWAGPVEEPEGVLDASLRLETTAAVRRAGRALARMQSKEGAWADSVPETALAVLALACTPAPIRSECFPPDAAGRALAWLEKASCKDGGDRATCEAVRLLALKTLGADERTLRTSQDALLLRLEHAAEKLRPPSLASAAWALIACGRMETRSRRRLHALAAGSLHAAERRIRGDEPTVDDAAGAVVLAYYLDRRSEILRGGRIFLSKCAGAAAGPANACEAGLGIVAMRVAALLRIAGDLHFDGPLRRQAIHEVRRTVRTLLAAQCGDGLWGGPSEIRVRTSADAVLALDFALTASRSGSGPF